VAGIAIAAGIATVFATMIVIGEGTTNVKSITNVGAATAKDSGGNGWKRFRAAVATRCPARCWRVEQPAYLMVN
jgi:hypothetical protein